MGHPDGETQFTTAHAGVGFAGGIVAGQLLVELQADEEGWYEARAHVFVDANATSLANVAVRVSEGRTLGLLTTAVEVAPVGQFFPYPPAKFYCYLKHGDRLQLRAAAADAGANYVVDIFELTLIKSQRHLTCTGRGGE